MPCEKNPRTLEDSALRRMCVDVVRHSVRFADEENDVYLPLLRRYSNKLPAVLEEIFSDPEDAETAMSAQYDNVYVARLKARRKRALTRRIHPEGSEKEIRDLLHFVFNKFQRKIFLSAPDFNEEVCSVISQNCKDLSSLTLNCVSLEPELCIPLFKNVKNLTDLSLQRCDALTSDGIQEIINSLVHLKTLSVYSTEIDEFGLYLLCGHAPPFSDDSSSGCCFTKRCSATSSLKLESINLGGRIGIKEAELACLLTHIPTLRNITPAGSIAPQGNAPFVSQGRAQTNPGDFTRTTWNFWTTKWIGMIKTISKIVNSRSEVGLPPLALKIEKVTAKFDDIQNWKAFFQYCPELKCLDVTVPCVNFEDDNSMVNELAETQQLQHLKDLRINFTETEDIFTEQFKTIWIHRGHQLTELSLLQPICGVPCISFSAITFILLRCPNLKTLNIDAHFPEDEKVPEDFPALPKLRDVKFMFSADGNMAYLFCYKFILSAKDISSFSVDCRGMDARLSAKLRASLTHENFPQLENIHISYFS